MAPMFPRAFPRSNVPRGASIGAAIMANVQLAAPVAMTALAPPAALAINPQGPLSQFSPPSFNPNGPPPGFVPGPQFAPPPFAFQRTPLAPPVFTPAPPIMRDPFTAATVADNTFVKTDCLAYFDTTTFEWLRSDDPRIGMPGWHGIAPIALYRRSGDRDPRASDGTQPQYAFRQGTANPSTPPAGPPDIGIADAAHPVTAIPAGSIVCGGSASIGAPFARGPFSIPSVETLAPSTVARTLTCWHGKAATTPAGAGEELMIICAWWAIHSEGVWPPITPPLADSVRRALANVVKLRVATDPRSRSADGVLPAMADHAVQVVREYLNTLRYRPGVGIRAA